MKPYNLSDTNCVCAKCYIPDSVGKIDSADGSQLGLIAWMDVMGGAYCRPPNKDRSDRKGQNGGGNDIFHPGKGTKTFERLWDSARVIVQKENTKQKHAFPGVARLPTFPHGQSIKSSQEDSNGS